MKEKSLNKYANLTMEERIEKTGKILARAVRLVVDEEKRIKKAQKRIT